MKKIETAFAKAKKNYLVSFLFLLTLSYVAYFSILQGSLSGIVISLLGISFSVYLLFKTFLFNRYLKIQRALVQEDAAKAMTNLKGLLGEMRETDSTFEDNMNSIRNTVKNKTILDERLYKKQQQRKEILDIIYAIKKYIDKENNIRS